MVIVYEFQCETCRKRFRAGYDAREDHLSATGHARPDFECDTCGRSFNTNHGRKAHMDALGHWGPRFNCDTCGRHFTTSNGRDQHMDALGHWGPDDVDDCGCTVCSDVFDDEDEAAQHEADQHFFCRSCDHYFQAYSDIGSHLNSHVHRNETINCFFCKRFFLVAEDIIPHLKSGACTNAPKLTSDQIQRFVITKDPGVLACKVSNSESGRTQPVVVGGVLHAKPSLQSLATCSNFNTGQVLTQPKATDIVMYGDSFQSQNSSQNSRDARQPTPLKTMSRSSDVGRDQPQYIATDMAWNGYDYECYICHELFATVLGLNEHLNSPTHLQVLYHCPTDDCHLNFDSLAAILGHLESETCGYVRFDDVQRRAHGLINAGRLLTA